MPEKLKEELKKMISEIIEISEEEIKPDADFFTDLGADSLKGIEIVAAFEKKYRVTVPEKDIPQIRTLNQIVKHAENLLNDK